VDFVLVLVVLVVVAVVVAWPLYRATRPSPGGPPETEALEAAKDAKLREIRETELDYRTGKLSEEDWRTTDAQLRAEAAVLLRALDREKGEDGED
jgi:hypothetical protein